MSEHQPDGNVRTAGFCGKCGSPIREGFRFCGRCGAPATVLPPEAAVPGTAPAPVEEPQREKQSVRAKTAAKKKRKPEGKRSSEGKTRKPLRTSLIIAAAVLVLGAGAVFLLDTLGVISVFGPRETPVPSVTVASREISQGEAAQLLGSAPEQVDDFYPLSEDDPQSIRYVLKEKKISDYCRMVREITLELKSQQDGTWQGTPVYGPWQAEWHLNGTWQLQSPGEITIRVLEANATTIRMEYSAVIDGKPYYGGNNWYSLGENRDGDREHCIQAVRQPDSDMPGEFRLSDEAGIIYVNGSRTLYLIRTETSETDDWKTEDEGDSKG